MMHKSESETTPLQRNRRRYQYSLRTLLVAVTLVAILLSGYKVYVKLTEPAFIVFATQWDTAIRNGDGIDTVREVLGPGQEPEDTSWITDKIQSHPDGYRDGLKNGDRFLLYELQHGRGCTVMVYVQFRNERLVNHSPPGIQTVRFVGP